MATHPGYCSGAVCIQNTKACLNSTASCDFSCRTRKLELDLTKLRLPTVGSALYSPANCANC